MDVFWINVLDVLKTCLEDVFGTGVCPLGYNSRRVKYKLNLATIIDH